MPVCGNYLFFELPKKIVLNPKDGCVCNEKEDLCGEIFPENKSRNFRQTSTKSPLYNCDGFV